MVQSEILVEASTRIEEDLGTDRSDGVGFVHYYESESVDEDGVNFYGEWLKGGLR